MRTLSIAITLILIATISLAQTAESLKERIQEHYTAINAGDSAATSSHHLQEFSILADMPLAFNGMTGIIRAYSVMNF